MKAEYYIGQLVAQGAEFPVIYDVGAWIGRWSQSVHRVSPKSQMVLFEANANYERILSETGFEYRIALLGAPQQGEVEFFGGTDTGDSYYKETTKFYDKVAGVRRLTITLDELAEQIPHALPDLIKLDTQGSELDIAKGATKVLEHASVLITECPIIEYNKGAPKINQYLEYLGDRGFIPVELLEAHKMEGVLVQVDIVFMKAAFKDKFIGPNPNVRVLEKKVC